jgi:hypothetical protein
MTDHDHDGDPRASGRTLDDEGVPDLEGPLPEKAATGDPQEGVSPPRDHPASFDYGVTEEEDRRGEPISVRVAREEPDELDPEADDPGVELLDEASIEGLGDDAELLGETEPEELEGLGAEDAAVHVRDMAPGGVSGPDSYVSGLDPLDEIDEGDDEVDPNDPEL